MKSHIDLSDEVLIAIRRVIRAVDQHSRTLIHSHGLTGPQALILKALEEGRLTAGKLARRVSMSQGTVTDILIRMEQRGLIQRIPDQQDRRRVQVEVTAEGMVLLDTSPPLLQERFIQRFNDLQGWEQTQLLSSLQRLATLMDAESIDAAPVLSSGSVLASVQAVEQVLEPTLETSTRKSRTQRSKDSMRDAADSRIK